MAGRISYPLYMVHYPFMWVFFSYVDKFKPAMSVLAWVIVAGVVLLLLLAYLVMKYIDDPVRKWLSK